MFGSKTTIHVPVTIDGETHLVPTPGPRIPRDWDHIILTSASIATGVAVLAAVGWSVSGIGGLLERAAPAGAAYAAAATFDSGWIICLAMEWLARYDRRRACLPRRAGWFALGIAMAALAVNGWLNAGWQVGIISACVSALAKGMWHVVLKQYAHPLDDLTQGWVEQRGAQLGARLALAATDRQAARAQHLLEAQRRATAALSGRPDTASGQVRDAVHAAADTLSGGTPETISAQLAAAGITVDTDTVRTVLSSPDTSTQQRLHTVTGAAPSISAAVRDALADGADTESAVFAHVRSVRPDASADTVRRLYSRHRAAS